MKIKRLFASMLLTVLTCTLFTGCSSSKVNRTLPEFNSEDTIIRSAWWCPEPTSENYDIYKECGLNTVMLVNHNFRGGDFGLSDDQLQLTKEGCYYIGTPDGFEGQTMTDKALAMAKEKGLDVILAEGESYFHWIGEDVDVYEDFTIDYSEYEDIIVGLFSGDEPSAPEIVELAKNIEKAEQTFPGIPYFANLFPYYASATQTLKTSSYSDYLNQYGTEFMAKTSQPRLLSVDVYPFIGANFSKWLLNYEMITEKALEYDADIHMFIQSAISADNSHRMLNEKEIEVQVNTALAYGAKAYSYFLYSPAGEGYPEGLIDGEGKPAEMYYHAQKANKQVASLENAYMHYDYVDTIPVINENDDYGDGAFMFFASLKLKGNVEESQVLENITTDNHALVALLRDKDGNEAFYVTNFYEYDGEDIDKDCTITLFFDGMKKVALYGSEECLTGEVQKLQGGTFECTLSPGEGMLVIPYRK